jgi:flagellar hook-basal body complex protein FliE
MTLSLAAANAAYQAASRAGATSAGEAAAKTLAADPAGGGFGDALADAMKSAVQTMRTGEAAATQGAAGQGDVVKVVNSVTAAELTLESVVAIRDRVISAYQDILKMPI